MVLNFWAFWCDTWRAEMPHLQELIPRQEELGFRLVAVSVDGMRLPEFQNRTAGSKTPFPVLVDVGGQVCARYKVAHVPTVVIIDRAGRVRYTAVGYPGNHVVLREVRKLTSMTGITRLADSLPCRIPVHVAQEQESIVGVTQVDTRLSLLRAGRENYVGAAVSR